MAEPNQTSDGECPDCGGDGHDGRGTQCDTCHQGWLRCASCNVAGDDVDGSDDAAFMFAGDAWLCKECAASPTTRHGHAAAIAPTVHLNGTDGEALRDQLIEAGRAIQSAMEALCQAAPNARDYPDRAIYQRSRDNHDAMHKGLRDTLAKLIASADHVMEQLEARAAQKASR